MNSLTETSFLQWANENGMGVDERYPKQVVLSFKPDPKLRRFWEVPAEPERRPYFIASILSLLGDWEACYVWRYNGSWPISALAPERINDHVEIQILKGIGLPLGTADVVAFSHYEVNQLVTLVFSTTIFGWCVNEDTYVVPDNAKYILEVSHHEAFHVSFRNAEDLNGFVSKMDEKGVPLPEDVPDETFKHPEWMKDN